MKEDVKNAVIGQDQGLFPGSFCKIIPDIADDREYCFAVHADGAGTKSSVAYMMYKETGDISWFEGVAQDSLVMNTDDLMCVGAVNHFFLSNTIGRNAHRIDGSVISSIIKGYSNLISKMAEFGIDITMTGGETADVGDLVRTLIVDSTIAVRMKRSEVIHAMKISPGDCIVGISSFGQSIYEKKINSGIGSNGLTAARHTLLHNTYRNQYPESVSETIPPEKIYCGKYRLSDNLPGSDLSVGESILSPTRTYLPMMAYLMNHIDRSKIHGLIHCTGGGQVKCKSFGRNLCYIKDQMFEWPVIFNEIYQSGGIDQREMYQIFNMGHRLEVYCSPETAMDIIHAAEKFSIEASIIGRVEENSTRNNSVIIRDRGEEFIY
jgi:phosphoribosylformylglycinamidine cyclo-ligase